MSIRKINLLWHLDKVSPGRLNGDHLPLLELLQDTPQGGEWAQILGPAAVPPWVVGSSVGDPHLLLCETGFKTVKKGIWSQFQWG